MVPRTKRLCNHAFQKVRRASLIPYRLLIYFRLLLISRPSTLLLSASYLFLPLTGPLMPCLGTWYFFAVLIICMASFWLDSAKASINSSNASAISNLCGLFFPFHACVNLIRRSFFLLGSFITITGTVPLSRCFLYHCSNLRTSMPLISGLLPSQLCLVTFKRLRWWAKTFALFICAITLPFAIFSIAIYTINGTRTKIIHLYAAIHTFAGH